MDGLNPHEINQQRVRPGVWLLAAGAVLFADFITSHASNIHIIPATENLETAIKKLQNGVIVQMEGLLVDVESNRGNIETSLIRTDSGANSCEILYLWRLVVDGKEYW